MPHIHLETTSDLYENGDIPDILEALVAELARQPSVRAETIKAYHSLRSVWAVGEGHPPGIAHCTVKVLSGRSTEVRAAMAASLLDLLRQRFSISLDSGEVRVSIEIREMDSETYLRA
jgi:5-carboxymethyl-2-hydroxymuconate isomerase